MNNRIVKKIRKAYRRPWLEYLDQVKEWPWEHRWRLAWWILFGKVQKKR